MSLNKPALTEAHAPDRETSRGRAHFSGRQGVICQRTKHQTMPLKWEFPGGKIEEGEQPRDALRRELQEELGINAEIGQELSRIRHEYRGGGAVELRFYAVHSYSGPLENRIFKDIRWAELIQLPTFDFLEADLTLVQSLAEGKIV